MTIKIQTNYKYKFGSRHSNKDTLVQTQEASESSKDITKSAESQNWHQKFIQQLKEVRTKYGPKPKVVLVPEVQQDLDREILDRMDKGTYKPSVGEQFADLVGKFKKPQPKQHGIVEESFTMDDLNKPTMLEKLKAGVGNVGEKLKKGKAEKKELNSEDEALDENLVEIQEGLINKRESPGVIKNAIEKLKNLSPKDQKKLLLLSAAALGLSVVAMHAAIPVLLGSTVGGVAGTGFGTFTGLGMGQSIFGLKAIETAGSVFATKAISSTIAIGAASGIGASAYKAFKTLNKKPENNSNVEDIATYQKTYDSRKITPEIQLKIDKINQTPNISDSRKRQGIYDIIKDLPKKSIFENTRVQNVENKSNQERENSNNPNIAEQTPQIKPEQQASNSNEEKYHTAKRDAENLIDRQWNILEQLKEIDKNSNLSSDVALQREQLEIEYKNLETNYASKKEFVSQYEAAEKKEVLDYKPDVNNIRPDLIKKFLESSYFGDSEQISLDFWHNQGESAEFENFKSEIWDQRHKFTDKLQDLLQQKEKLEGKISKNENHLFKGIRNKSLIKINEKIVENYQSLLSLHNKQVNKALELQSKTVS